MREYFPAALEAFDDLDAADTLDLLGKAPDPTAADRLSRTQISAALRRARRRDIDTKTTRIRAALRTVLGARVLTEFGDDPSRYITAKNRKNYAGTSPITRASGKRKLVAARYVHNDRLVDTLMLQAQSALQASHGARAYYDRQRARGLDHNPRCARSPTGSSASCTGAWPGPAQSGTSPRTSKVRIAIRLLYMVVVQRLQSNAYGSGQGRASSAAGHPFARRVRVWSGTAKQHAGSITLATKPFGGQTVQRPRT